MNEDNSFFLRYKTSILIIIVAIFVVAGILLWMGTLKNIIPINQKQSGNTLTEEQIQAIIKDRPIGPGTLTTKQRSAILNDKPTGTSTLSAEQRNQILNDKPK